MKNTELRKRLPKFGIFFAFFQYICGRVSFVGGAMRLSQMTKYTAASTASSLIMRGLGLGFSVFLTSHIGAEGIGLMTLINSVYALGVSFSAAGYRLATTRLAVEDKNSKSPNAFSLLSKILLLAIFTGCISAAALGGGAEFIAVKILKESRSIKALKILALSLPILAVNGVLCAYLGAFYKVVKIGFVQCISQVVQIAYVALSISKDVSIEDCCIRIARADVIGEAVSLILAIVFVYSEIKDEKRVYGKKKFFRPFIRIALPDALGYELRSALSTVQQLLVPIGFRKSGVGAAKALEIYGVMHGMALQVVMFPSCILRSLASLLIPSITQSRTLHNEYAVKRTVRRVLHLTLVFSFMVASVMFFCSDILANTLYKSDDCAVFLRIFAPLIPIMYLDICTDSMLKGLDKQVASMGYNLLDSAISVVMVYFLIPKYQVTGYVIMVFFTETMNTLLSMRELLKASGTGLFPFTDVINPLICAVSSGMLCAFLGRGIPPTALGLCVKILLNLGLYVSFMLISSPETKEDIFSMLGIRKKALS